jgi:RNA polymerase sigma-70 factor (ECF subfamily)
LTDSDAKFIDLYERFYRPVYAYCRRRTTAEKVDDAVADTFLVAWRKIDQVPRGSEVLPWLMGVAYRVLGTQWRGSSRSKKLDRKLTSIGHEAPIRPDEVILVREQSQQVLAAHAALKQTDREILLLAAWEELPQADIAVVLNISIGAVRQRLHEAKKNLAKEYDRLSKRRHTPAAKKGGAR